MVLPFRRWKLILWTFALAGSGCVNRYVSSYVPVVDPSVASASLAPYSGQTQIITSAHMGHDAHLWTLKGYAIIGQSTYETSDGIPQSVRASQAKIQAATVGADVVLMKVKDLGSRTFAAESAPHLDQTDPDSPEWRSVELTYTAEWMRCSALYLRKKRT